MTTSQTQLLSLLSNALFGHTTDAVLTDDVLHEAQQHTVRTFVSGNEFAMITNNVRVNVAHTNLAKDLAGIPFVTIKGYASAYYYPKPVLRPMGDVDFYVTPDRYTDAKDALIGAGYRQVQEEHERHESFWKNNVLFELHSEIKGVPNGRDGIRTDSKEVESIVRGYLADIVDTAVRVRIQQGEIIIPDDFHHGLIMLLHVAGHMISDGGIGLRHLCDWAVYAGRVDVSAFRNPLTEMGLWTFACQLTALCTMFLGLKRQDWAGTWDERFLCSLMEDILSGGNFGQKEKIRRGVENQLFRDRHIASSVVQMTEKRYPVVKKWPVLIPGAVFYEMTRYLFRSLTGQQKPVNKVIREVRSRYDLYAHFRLFETGR